jgi:hypothetical protein
MTAIKWASGKSGNWNTAADWTGGVVPGAGDDVTIDAAGAFTVNISAADAAHSLTLDNATATIVDTGHLTIGSTLALTAGTFDLEARGEITGGTLSASGGAFVFNGGTLNGVTMDGALSLASYSSLHVTSLGLIVKGVGGTGDGSINLAAVSSIYFQNTQTLDNAAINLAGSFSGPTGIVQQDTTGKGATLTLGADLVIDMNTTTGPYTRSSEIYGGKSAGDAIVNEGLIDVSAKHDVLNITALTFTNAGTIEVSNGGEVSFGDALTTAQLGKVELGAGGGFVDFAGTLNNSGATLAVATGEKPLGVIDGGVIAGTIERTLDYNRLTLDDTTVEGAIYIVGNQGAGLTIAGGLEMTGAGGKGAGRIDISGRYCKLDALDTQTIDNATINIGATSGGAFISVYDDTQAGVTLTLGGHVTINQTAQYAGLRDGAGAAGDAIVNDGVINASYDGGDFETGVRLFTNAGTIDVTNGATLTLGQNRYSWSNTGTIAVTNATVDLDYGFTLAALGNLVNNDGTVNINGTLNNAGSTLNVGTGTTLGALTLTRFGVISGGTLVDNGSGIVFNGGTMAGVTFDGTLDLTAAYSVLQVADPGIIANGAGGTGAGAINLTGYDSRIYFENTQTLDNATINIGNADDNAFIEELANTQNATLTLGIDLAIDQAGKFAQITTDGHRGAGIVNAGTINASFHGGHFDIARATFTNTGTISVSQGDTVYIDTSTKFTNLSFGTLSGGRFEVDAGSTLQLADNQSVTTDNAAIILSGTGSNLQSVQTNHVLVTIDSTLASITAAGTLEILAGRNWSSTLAMANAGTLDLGGGTFAPASLDNSGVVSGFGVIATTLTNGGAVSVSAGQTLSLVGGDLANLSGESLNGGAFTVGSGGTLQLANNTSIVTLNAAIDLNGVGSSVQGFNTATSSEVSLESSLQTIGAAGALEILGGRDWSSTLVMHNAGTLDLGGGTFAPASLNNTGVVRGEGLIEAHVIDAGVVEAASGTLELGQWVNGRGYLRIGAGSTLQADAYVAAPLTASFDGPGGVLAMAAPSLFKATIAAFASGDAIDLLQKAATGATLEAGDKLVVTNGARTVATLQLSGDYAGDSFSVAADGHGGTEIVLASPPPTAPAAAQFVQAMSAVSTGHAGFASANADTWRPHSTMLVNPRTAIA